MYPAIVSSIRSANGQQIMKSQIGFLKRLSTRLNVIIIGFAILPLVAAGFLAYGNGQDTIEQRVFSHLQAVNLIKVGDMERWLKSNEFDLEFLAQRPLVREYVATLAACEPRAPECLNAEQELLSDHLLPAISGKSSISELSIIRKGDGLIWISTDPDMAGKFREQETYFLEGLKGTYTDNVTYSLEHNEAVLHVSTPVFGPGGELLAVLAAHIDIDALTDIIAYKGNPSTTEDTYLINQFNFFVTDPRFNEGVALKRSAQTEGIDDCLAGNTGFGFYMDYRGEPVLGAYQWLPEQQMCILTEIDQAEAYAPIQELRNSIHGLVLGTALVAVLLGVIFARSLTRPIDRLVAGAEEIGAGNLKHRNQVSRQDEIGVLARSFDHMAANLEKAQEKNSRLIAQLETWGQDLETRVEERTRELKKAQTATLNILQDVEDARHKAELANAELNSEKAFTDQVINSIPGVFYVFDSSGKFIRWNDNFSSVTEYSDDEIAQMHPTALFEGSDREHIGERIQAAFETGISDAEANFTTKSGRKIPYYFTGYRTIIDEQPILIGTGVDISDLRQAQLELTKKAEDLERSNKELEQFAYVASHDLQEPLRMVASYLQLLERRYGDKLDGDAREFIDFAVDGATRMKTLINDLLTFSRVGTRGRAFEPTDLNVVLGRVRAFLGTSIEENNALLTSGELPTILADESQMVQLFQNLVGNAIKFRGEEEPRIHIEAQQEVNGANGQKEWLFSVRDNGIGIEAQYFERIFAIFQRLHNKRQYPGTGIGLAVSKRIVDRHAGKIWVESQPGEGTTFFFTIPELEG